jgi:hypothetical protein
VTLLREGEHAPFRAGDVIRERQRNARHRLVTHVNDNGSIVTVGIALTSADPRPSGRVTTIAAHRLGAFDLVPNAIHGIGGGQGA